MKTLNVILRFTLIPFIHVAFFYPWTLTPAANSNQISFLQTRSPTPASTSCVGWAVTARPQTVSRRSASAPGLASWNGSLDGPSCSAGRISASTKASVSCRRLHAGCRSSSASRDTVLARVSCMELSCSFFVLWVERLVLQIWEQDLFCSEWDSNPQHFGSRPTTLSYQLCHWGNRILRLV